MKKRNLHLISTISIFISIFILYSCKNNFSSSSALIEQISDKECSYAYMKHVDDDEYKPVTHYCITSCEECPTDLEVNAFNTGKKEAKKEAKEAIYKKCPLRADNTIYIDKVLYTYNEMLRWNSTLTLERKDKNQTLKIITETSGGSLNKDNIPIYNISKKNIKTSETEKDILTKCARDVSDTDAVYEEEYNDPNSCPVKGYETRTCKTVVNNKEKVEKFLVDKEKKIWKVDINTERKNRKEVSVPKGWRYPKTKECSQELLAALNCFLTENQQPLIQSTVGWNGPYSGDRFWLEEKDLTPANEVLYNTCSISNDEIFSSGESKAFYHLVFVKKNNDPCN